MQVDYDLESGKKIGVDAINQRNASSRRSRLGQESSRRDGLSAIPNRSGLAVAWKEGSGIRSQLRSWAGDHSGREVLL